MAESEQQNVEGIEIRTYFVRNRNALLARAFFSELFVDYYLHLADNGLKNGEAEDDIFKTSLALFALHCASRPWNEITAWTVNFQEPLMNLFLGGDNTEGSVVGRVFTENVKEGAENLFFAETVRGREPLRRSGVNFTGSDPLSAVERFYEQSEQRPARCFRLGEEDFALLSAHPDCDMEWFRGVDTDGIRGVDKDETLSLLERRIYRWNCGCNQDKIMGVLAPSMRSDPEGLFGEDDSLRLLCPRCGGRYSVTREAMEAYVAGKE